MAEKHGPVGLVHVDAHADINDTMFGEPIAHGTPFRRAVEEGLIDDGRGADRPARVGLCRRRFRLVARTRGSASSRQNNAGISRWDR